MARTHDASSAEKGPSRHGGGMDAGVDEVPEKPRIHRGGRQGSPRDIATISHRSYVVMHTVIGY
ncbi:hypothetical protein B005_3216 [Nocardiopsis alba ATCC BAA-2165]|uniref:Uncharacterized protein n=1 Tax=Nocardiopsis alba (strain ATCC BAA-2165 / BE74) TaxID=1205910 RepID=J7LDT8_NOCAA|nr:hypothetical protein B005_3216 [Nocardiopsis alba ATCC BAA-2165]